MTPARVWLTVLPASLLLVAVAGAVVGDDGLFAHRRLSLQLWALNEELRAVEAENMALLRELRSMDRDPRALERLVYDELAWGREGETLYRFEEAEPVTGEPTVSVAP